jgi:hypothetical protein
MKNKILIFIGGLVAGVTIGVLFSVAIKTLISQFRELHISLNKIDLRQSQLSQRLDSIQGKLVPDTKKPGAANTQAMSKSLPPNPIKIPTTPGVKPQSALNSASNNPVVTDSDVVVMTDQLLVATSVSLENKDTLKRNKKTEKMDSTIAALSDVTASHEPQEYRVEFWKSPLNYKGYKMSKGKIIIYGMQPAGGFIFLTKDGTNYYLVNGTARYKLEYTDAYKPLEQVTEKNLQKN